MRHLVAVRAPRADRAPFSDCRTFGSGGVHVEPTAPTTALVIGFPLLMMLVMLLMNTVERWLTSQGRAPLRLVPGTAADDGEDDGEPAEASTVALEPPAAAEAAIAAALGASDSGSRAIELHPPFQLVNATRSAGRVSAADARS